MNLLIRALLVATLGFGIRAPCASGWVDEELSARGGLPGEKAGGDRAGSDRAGGDRARGERLPGDEGALDRAVDWIWRTP